MTIHRVIAAILLLSSLPLAAQEHQENDQYLIRLGDAAMRPDSGDFSPAAMASKVFIMQFQTIPNADRRESLSSEGIEILRYVGGNAYLVRRVHETVMSAPAAGVRAIIPFEPQMKRSPLLNRDPELQKAVASNSPILLSIRFLPGTSKSEAMDAIQSAGLEVTADRFIGSAAIIVRDSWEVVSGLLSNENVEWVEPTVLRKKGFNEISAERMRVDEVRDSADYRNATGEGIRIALWDGGPVDKHTDFENRLTVVEQDRSTSDHATHVAGTMAGAGILDKSAMGMAPDALIYSYDFYDDEIAEMRSAADKYNILVSNNSWGSVIGWDIDSEDDELIYKWYGDLWYFASYSDNSRGLDQLVRDKDVLVVFATGNSRGDFQLGDHRHNDGSTNFTDFHPSNPIYGSASSRSSAKNVVGAGATMKDDFLTAFSGWGPTDDGRIKPDVVANGFQLYSTDLSNSYSEKSGTSMATPSVSGAATLLADYFQRRHGKSISSDMLKNLLIHSARDLGRPGPDYEYGHGIVDVEMGARIVKKAAFSLADFPISNASKKDEDDGIDALMLTGDLANGKKNRFKFVIPEGVAEMRVTLVWHDSPGEGLINDLDMWVKIKGGGKYKPYVLNPANPTANATTGSNHVDNVESIFIANPKAAKTKITVRGTKVPMGPQRYTLIVSLSDGHHAPAIVDAGDLRTHDLFPSTSSDFDNIPPKTTLVDGDEFYYYVRFFVDENSDFGDYFGSIGSFWRILDATGKEVFSTHLVSQSLEAREKFWRWRLGPYEINDNLPTGNYTIEVVLLMNNGFTRTISSQFNVQ